MYKSPYTISVWETNVSPTDGKIKETKICNIGSDKMTISARALEPKLQRNINGKMSFSFKMYKECYDVDIGNIIEYLKDENDDYLLTSEEFMLIVRTLQNRDYTGKYDNPFLPLLINERVIKVNWEGDWFDFIIKNIQEDSAAKSYTFQCESWLVQELSKQGFNLEFDEKLENNQGTVGELAAKILKDTNWEVGTIDVGYEYNKESVYDITDLLGTFDVLKLPGFEEETIENGRALVFFSSVNGLSEEGGQTILQFVYSADGQFITEPNSQMVKDSETMNYQINVTYTYDSNNGTYSFYVNQNTLFCSISIPRGVSTEYRAKKLVNSLKTIYDPIVDKYCYILVQGEPSTQLYTTDTNEPLYIEMDGQLLPIYKVGDISSSTEFFREFKDTDYNFARYIQNLIANGSGFTTSDGWRKVTETTQDELVPYVDAQNVKSYLKIPNAATTTWIFNSSIRSSRKFVQTFIKDEIYYFRVRMKNKAVPPFPAADIKIAQYTDYDDFYPTSTSYFVTDGGWTSEGGDEGFYRIKLKCVEPLNIESVIDAKVGLFFHCDTNGAEYVELEEAQLFKEMKDEQGEILTPTSFDASGVIKDLYYVYKEDDTLTSKDQLEFVYKGEQKITVAKPEEDYRYLTTQFHKVRTLTGKESNRFNLLQSLAEKFECWCVIRAAHDSTGAITQRYVDFKDTVGEDQNIGFIYGLDLKTVKRTVDSKQIVTKTIVKTNSNKYGNNGFCTIARAPENYPKVNYVFDFGYYINQGLLNNGALNEALYSVDPDISYKDPTTDPPTPWPWPAGTPKGYFVKLHQFNNDYDAAADKYEKYKLQFDNLGAYLKVFNSYKENTESKKYQYMLYLFNLGKFVTDTSNESLGQLWSDAHNNSTSDVYKWYHKYVKPEVTDDLKDETSLNATKYNDAIIAAINNEEKYTDQIESIKASMNSLDSKITTIEAEMKTQVEYINAADLQFQRLYGQFIQEGTWSSEDYYNDTLYYLDALDVAYTSARPRITYSIDVLRLNGLPNVLIPGHTYLTDGTAYQNKIFKLGDIAYVEDTEYFGYTTVNDIKTPYHEKVVLTELTQNFDDPSKDQFKVQNYRTQFEDLFQRITASVQSLQWNEADYGRAVDAVQKDETINTDILQSSLNNAQNLVRNSLNNAITQDATGISIVNQNDPTKQSHINAEGFFISTDGGDNWRNAVSAEGVATELLTAGAIDTNRISIMDGASEAFRWDASGINAYKYQNTGANGGAYGTFVRFDKWGIYGRNSTSTDFKPTSEQAIWDDPSTKFALTWSGLHIKSISGNKKFEVGDLTNGFGIELTDTSGTTPTSLFKVDDQGNVFIKGEVEADEGHIGGANGFKIETGNLYTSYTSTSPQITKYSGIRNSGSVTTATDNIFYAGADNISGQNAKFRVTADGTLYAREAVISGSISANAISIAQDASHPTTYLLNAYVDDGGDGHVNIGGFTVNDYAIYNTKLDTNSNKYYLVGMSNYGTNDGNHRFAAGLISNDGSGSWSEAAFRVTMDGSMYATKGEIGGFTIDSNHIYSGYKNSQQTDIYFGMRKNATNVGDNQILFFAGATGTIDPTSANFYVTSSGSLFCNSATIEGTITATNGTFNGSIGANGLKLSGTGSILMADGTPVLQLLSTTGLSIGYIGSSVVNRFYMGNNYFGITINSNNYTLTTHDVGNVTYLVLIPD